MSFVEVAKAFAEHVALPKEWFIVYELPKIPEPAYVVRNWDFLLIIMDFVILEQA
jgi:hypothetical protein